jgi:hypothetical protein
MTDFKILENYILPQIAMKFLSIEYDKLNNIKKFPERVDIAKENVIKNILENCDCPTCIEIAYEVTIINLCYED